MRKALCVGIDSYKQIGDLHGCVNDANAVKNALERNGDATLNFDVKALTATSESSYVTKDILRDAVEELFKGAPEVALFYYAGHGSIDEAGGYLCTSEITRPENGLALNDIMAFASNSKAQNKIIILDSCYSGEFGNATNVTGSILTEGTTILAACGKDEYSSERNNSGIFTSLLVEALYGGAMNLLGEVSPGSIYSYIDQSLGAWEQRPVFKANIKTFVCLRKNNPPISLADLQRITDFFTSPYEAYPLDPTYEPDKHEADTHEVNRAHEEIFRILQKYNRLNLVIPVGEDHMYYAAIHRKACKLTAQGQHYWKLVNDKKI